MTSKLNTPGIALVFALISTGLSASDNFIRDSSFELGKGWNLFIPPESKSHGVKFEYVAGGINGSRAGRLSSDEVTRAALSNTRFAVVPGERYQISFSYKAEPNGVVATGQPGLVIRVNLLDNNKVTLSPIYVLYDGKVVPAVKTFPTPAKLATEWTKVEAIVDAPMGVSTFDINLFLWGYQGAILFDDISMQLAP